MDRDLTKAQQLLGYNFSDISLLETALTHPSYANENGVKSYERLEFLGDAVIGLIVAHDLFLGKDLCEGALTKIKQQYVSRDPLCAAFSRTGLEQFVLVSRSLKDGITDDMREDLFEALVGAVYLDGGIEAARKVTKKFLERIPVVDYVSKVKEYSEKSGKQLEYIFREEENQGIKTFYCKARLGDIESDECRGLRKRAAQQLAAKDLMGKI